MGLMVAARSGGHELFNLAASEVFSVICHFVQLRGIGQPALVGMAWWFF